ncbi:Imm50 family immunity protein [Paraburkholderia diazotrophica]|uniref:Imm50 family immunity protein n=1 Tax=Paraburkholderia diazotrophica TaxID=667676 RepID=UPI000B83BFE3|nr:Imm50 family immunity protein [Paraburkholderia diazotrophica]
MGLAACKKNNSLLIKIFGEYPSFHDSAVRTFCMQRKRRSFESVEGKPLPNGRSRDLLDLELEVLHNRYGPLRSDGSPDYLVVLEFLDIRSSEIDVNAMLEEASIMDISLSKEPNGLIKLDLMPNIGLDIRLTCKEVVVSSIRPYLRGEP